jgi:zinc protease
MNTRHCYLLLIFAGCNVFLAPRAYAQDTTFAAPTMSAAAKPALASLASDEKPLPTTKELLAKNDSVMGGHEAWAKVTSRMMKGVYQTEDASAFFGIEILQKAPNKSLYKLTFPNNIVLRDVCDGHSAWVEDPVGGYHEITGAALASRLRRSELLDRGRAFLLAATGKVFGMEKVGTHSTYVIEYSPEKSVTSRLYFDADNGYVVRTEDVYTTLEGPYTVKLDLDDYREVDGLRFPFRIRRTEKGAIFNIRITQVKNNVSIDESAFLKPESSAK